MKVIKNHHKDQGFGDLLKGVLVALLFVMHVANLDFILKSFKEVERGDYHLGAIQEKLNQFGKNNMGVGT